MFYFLKISASTMKKKKVIRNLQGNLPNSEPFMLTMPSALHTARMHRQPSSHSFFREKNSSAMSWQERLKMQNVFLTILGDPSQQSWAAQKFPTKFFSSHVCLKKSIILLLSEEWHLPL